MPHRDFTTASLAAYLHLTPQQVERLAQWFKAGSIRAVIDKVLPMEEAREAHRIADTGHKRGSVILMMDQEVRI